VNPLPHRVRHLFPASNTFRPDSNRGIGPMMTAGPKGIVIVGWDGGRPRGLPSVGLPLALQLGHGSLWAVPAIGNEVNGSNERIDLATSTAKIFAGGGQIGGFTVDADGVYWTRDGKPLFAPMN
jgi:hypothetical protein